MAEETFRPEKRKITSEDFGDDLPVKEMRELPGVEIKGNIPPAFREAMRQTEAAEAKPSAKEVASHMSPVKTMNPYGAPVNEKLEKILAALQQTVQQWEPVMLPSKGKFYNGKDGPTDGVLRVKAMTGHEEQILATPRYIKRGQAINMIFKNCVQEKIDPEKLLSVDRTFLLIYIRGISYSTKYEVEVKCPECTMKFSTAVDLDNDIVVNHCPDDFTLESLTDVLPRTKFNFRYRLATGDDEQKVVSYREQRIKSFGDQVKDDTMAFRASLLIEELEGVTSQHDIQNLIEKLPIEDVSYIRNLINDPPFGVDTNVSIDCPSCTANFNIDLPMEANFFFPRKRRKDR